MYTLSSQSSALAKKVKEKKSAFVRRSLRISAAGIELLPNFYGKPSFPKADPANTFYTTDNEGGIGMEETAVGSPFH